ncbi:hypothetical protein [Mycobacterium terramassiliense]|uniref:Uncharacterized protein n=1 Tax=Mycobacterium terramassiliense TaxID=1841859 RepID=A0A2U3NGA3_9MYCO|nr:hypothetical protein [Mycobacterium terramassiliense]SPM30520.1 hypothetical protein MTAB308_4028 [Mycobacterium terramassiliense]
MSHPIQTVIYHHDAAHTPAWQFFSLPDSIVGGGNTLDSARAKYRGALKFSRGVGGLPDINEYVETEADNLDIWVRTPLSDTEREAATTDATRQLETHPEDRAWFDEHLTAGGYPVVVPGVLDDPISSIFNQMTAFDSLVVWTVYRSADRASSVWLVMAGNRSAGDESLTSLETLGLTESSPLSELVHLAVERELNTFAARFPR